jgi:hypothetical protein
VEKFKSTDSKYSTKTGTNNREARKFTTATIKSIEFARACGDGAATTTTIKE